MHYASAQHSTIHFNADSISVRKIHYPLKRLLARLAGRTPYEQRTLSWNDVTKATVYKRDVFAHDLICIWLRTGEGSGIEINERMLNWENAVNELPTILPGCLSIDEWFRDVAFPPFEENAITIFNRFE
ncbi:MAG: hypothetical protein ABL984_04405 [Pyrinomonadaceae bacterium]